MRRFPRIAALATVAALALVGRADAQVTTNGGNDGGRLAGHLGVGFFPAFALRQTENAPAFTPIGVRYWMGDGAGGKAMGVDLGLGFRLAGGDGDGKVSGVSLHAGLPIVLASFQHANFELVPELDLAFAGIDNETIADESLFGVSVGARAGLEIFFGFIGVPQLSLEATVGAGFGYGRHHVDGVGTNSRWALATSVQDSPRDTFLGNIAAHYYF